MPNGIKGFQKGYVPSEEHRRKISIATAKYRTGRKSSIETRKKLSIKKLGMNNPNWKGGISPKNKLIRMSIDFRLWREAVFARDNYTCKNCGVRGGKIHPHHIKEFAKYPELRFAIDNGKTLCAKCHSIIHKKQLDN